MLRIFITIERAVEADAPRILALQRLAFQAEAELYQNGPIAPLTQTLDELREDFARETVLKALSGERLVGSVRAHLEGATCEIGRLMVHPAYQRHGIGTALMAAIECWFPEARRLELFTGSHSAGNFAFYQKLGYARMPAMCAAGSVALVFFEKRRLAPTNGHTIAMQFFSS